MEKDGVPVFFYVDDIVIAFEEGKQQLANNLIKSLNAKYEMTGRGDLRSFLGIEVIRNRKQRTIQLSQASFIDKMAKLLKGSSVFLPPTPMRNIELLPHDGQATPSSITLSAKNWLTIIYAGGHYHSWLYRP